LNFATLSDDLATWQQYKVVEILYKNASIALSANVVVITLLTFVLSDVFPLHHLLIWFSFGQLVNLIRYIVIKLFYRERSRFDQQVWLNLHRIFTFISGCFYGSLAIFFFNREFLLYETMDLFLIAGMTSAAVTSYAADQVSSRAFLFPAILPFIYSTISFSDKVHIILAMMLVLFIGLMLRIAKQINTTIIDNIVYTHDTHYHATHDGLVDLLNRRQFQKVFEQQTSMLSHTKTSVSLIFIDIDNFKALNDTHGHKIGDNVLIKVSNIIRTSIRKSDVAARFGGDEFMVMIVSPSDRDAHTVSKKILEKLKCINDEHEYPIAEVCASIGIGFSHRPPFDYEDILLKADQACYEAKHSGKGIICAKEVKESKG
jgi:diguanylate cyclase (GGDEF)-like protein